MRKNGRKQQARTQSRIAAWDNISRATMVGKGKTLHKIHLLKPGSMNKHKGSNMPKPYGKPNERSRKAVESRVN